MKFNMKLYAFIGLLILVVGCFSVAAQDVDKIKFPNLNKLEIPEVERMTLDNGIRLYLLEDRSLPVFNVAVRINCGSHLEPADKIGLAGICGTVMRTGGTSKWSGDEIDELLEGVGGSVETSIGLGSGSASVNVLNNYADMGLEVLAEVLRRPKFETDKIDLAKVQARSGISRRNDDPQQVAFREFRKVIYGAESVYARHVEYATINAIEQSDLIEYHAKYYKPQNIQMAIWGDFDKKELVDKINKYFGDWKKEGDPVPALPAVEYKFDNQVFYVNKTDVNQSNIVLGHIGGLITDPGYPELIVMNNILGGSFGSRLFNAVRSREGLAYAVFGSYSANITYPGIFVNFASTKSETTVKTVREIIKELKRMQTDKPTENEMRAGKDGYLNSFVFNFDSKAEVVNRLMNYDFHGLSDDYLFKIKSEVEKVTSEAVIEAANKYLRPDALRILVVGKGEDFEMPLDQTGLGPVTTIDITIPSGEEKQELLVNDETIKAGQDLLMKAIDAAGGMDAVNNIKSISTKTTMLITTPQGEFPIQGESIHVFPDKSRQVANFMGQTMYSIFDGNVGWQTTQAGLIAMNEDDIIKEKKTFSRHTVMVFKNIYNPDYKIVYSGKGNINDIDVEYVTMLNKESETICRVGIGNDGTVLTKEYWGEAMTGEGMITDFFSDHQSFKGVKLPLNVVRTMNGSKIDEHQISEIVVNGDIPENAFSKPE